MAVREARLITKELRHLGVPPQTIAKIWGTVVGIPIILVLGYLALNYDSGTADPSILKGVQIMYKDAYQSHVKNNTAITLKSLTMTCMLGRRRSTRHVNNRALPAVTTGITVRMFMSVEIVV